MRNEAKTSEMHKKLFTKIKQELRMIKNKKTNRHINRVRQKPGNTPGDIRKI